MKIYLSSHKIKEIVAEFAQQLKVQPEFDCEEGMVSLPKSVGIGVIKGLSFPFGLALLMVKCELKDDLKIKYQPHDFQPLQFLFSLKGETFHSIDSDFIQYGLSPLQGSITASKKTCDQKITLPANQEIQLCSLQINREAFLKKINCDLDSIPEKLASAFRDKCGNHSFYYQSNYSFAIAECINEVYSNTHEGLVRKAYMESKAQELFSLQVKQYQDDMMSEGNRILLRKNDVALIKKAKDLLLKDLKNPPTIKALSKLAGINEYKLKKGFRTIYSTSIYKYLREERLEKAKLLLLEDTLNIEEIASKVGYSNKSHFARRFREKFGSLPSEFVKRFQSEVL
ncbi:helix-turn-helix transcriptional regulator [Flexithrix dorotheae]|uniref:helix-turn-helix transcriptional regulator n=1 Tax=Flexithrix dorotheae TaxID=70993 RepID=UPI0003651311|nr:AraC family transcriptional regulator [Flexithrix dorotheae]